MTLGDPDASLGTVLARRGSRLRAVRGYRHMLMGSYSLDSLGRQLADCGVTHWRVDFTRASARSRSFDAVTIIFSKD